VHLLSWFVPMAQWASTNKISNHEHQFSPTFESRVYSNDSLSPRVSSNDSLSPRVSSNDSLFKSTWHWLCLQQYMATTLSSRVHRNDSLCQPDPYIFSAYKMHTEGLYTVLSMKTDCWISQRSLTKVCFSRQ
jgi:hypothetical protein